MDAVRKRKAASMAVLRKKSRRKQSEFVSVEVGMREFKKRLAAGDVPAAAATTEDVNLTQNVKPRAKPKPKVNKTTEKKTIGAKTATVKKTPVKRTTRAKTAAAPKLSLVELKVQLEREQKERVECRIQTLRRQAKGSTGADSVSCAVIVDAPVAVASTPVTQTELPSLEQQNQNATNSELNTVAVPTATGQEHLSAVGNHDVGMQASSTIPTTSGKSISTVNLPSSPVKNVFIADDMDEDLLFAMALDEVEQKLATPQKSPTSTDVMAATDTLSASVSLQAPVASPSPAKPASLQVEVQPIPITSDVQPQLTQIVKEIKQHEPAEVASDVLEEMERLRRENELLRRSNELLQAAVTSPAHAEISVDERPLSSSKNSTARISKDEPATPPKGNSHSTGPTARYLDLTRCDSDHDLKQTLLTIGTGDIQEHKGDRNSTETPEPLDANFQEDTSALTLENNSHQDQQKRELDQNSTAATSQDPPVSTLSLGCSTPSYHSPATLDETAMPPEKDEPMEPSSLEENVGEQSVRAAAESDNGDVSNVSLAEVDEDEIEQDPEEEQEMEDTDPAPRSSTIDTGNYTEYKAHNEADEDEDMEENRDTDVAFEEHVDPASPTASTPVDPYPSETMVINEPDAVQKSGTPASSDILERMTAPSNTEDKVEESEDEDVSIVTRVKRREVIETSSSSSSESESEDDEADNTPLSSNVLEAALRAAGGDSKKPANTVSVTVKKNNTPKPKPDLHAAVSTSPPSVPVKSASKKRKSPGLSFTSKKTPSVKSSLLWPALDEFYDFLLDLSPGNVRGFDKKRLLLQKYSHGKLPAQHASIEDYCSVQIEAIMEELMASVSNITDRRGGGSSGPTRQLSLASISPCGGQGMSTPSKGLSLGAIFSESGFTGNTSGNNDYILTFDASALGKKASSDFLSGDLVLLRSPRWKNYEMCVFGVVLCDSVVAVGGKSGPGGKGGAGESDQICVLIRAQQRDQDDAVENFSVLTELCLSNQRVPNWRWSMQQVHNTTTSAREFQAIKSVSFFSNDLKQVLQTGKLVPAAKTEQVTKKAAASASILSPRLLKYLHKHYNDSQVQAILGCLGEDSRVIVQGPVRCAACVRVHLFSNDLVIVQPGTGKTKTILGLLSALLDGAGLSTLQKAKGTARIRIGASLQSARTSAVSKTVAETSIRVLVAAPSNAAVDELVVRVLSEGLFDGGKGESYRPRIVRVGRPESSQQLSSLAAAREASESKKNRKKMRKYAREVEEVLLESLVTKHRSTFPTVKQARQAIIKNAQIVFCTLSGAGSVAMCEFAQDFDALIIDEAAQAVEASTLIPFKFRPHRVVLVGDHRQLPATVMSKKLVAMGYDRSLQQRLVENDSPVLLLNQQYRMHPEIAEFPSSHFYGGRLVQDDNMSEWTAQEYHQDRAFKPLLFLDVEGSQSQVSGSTSLRNMSEVEAVVQLIRRLLTEFPRIEWKKRIGVIAPYKQQIYEVRGAIGKLETEFDRRLGIEVNTVDGFQGREKEIIIYSCVRTSHGGRRKKRRSRGNNEDDVLDAFWADERRMNVAITRAKSSLWIVGNSNLLKQSRAWRALIQHTKDHDRYIDDSAASLFTASASKTKTK
ncbi:putative helicase MAGATAMA 3 [Phytophthora citrophthora]|uniref:Helicase MAGATAMA 3 n=1 Tax=Phytophthora citrophthora TaxID=4793 RepID=A0AAD9GE00_9STRA|nr:putative helicase MAGATAMA 3 [Phytophthora citrophthora]